MAIRILTESVPLHAAAWRPLPAGLKSRLKPNATRVIDSVQKNRNTVLREVFIAGPPRAFPVPVIINHNDPILGQARKKLDEFVLGRGIPVRVESQQ